MKIDVEVWSASTEQLSQDEGETLLLVRTEEEGIRNSLLLTIPEALTMAEVLTRAVNTAICDTPNLEPTVDLDLSASLSTPQ